MATTATDFLARGKVTSTKDGVVVFEPSDANYQLHLQCTKTDSVPIGQLLIARVGAKARKVYTVPSGGNFIQPLFGSPRIIQGRALFLDDKLVVIRATIPISVQLPMSDDALDLSEGWLKVGAIVNAVTFPGATFEFVSTDPAR
jgi:hypothetical protein